MTSEKDNNIMTNKEGSQDSYKRNMQIHEIVTHVHMNVNNVEELLTEEIIYYW